ncbi:sigma 54-interacting transcriptional regulator [Neobacillus cucumis]|uniref:sigma 54-interacting transcriptional regulator n=1 Tax=Neobacillus cucumis TaxID=1740721 RepID=UPI0025708659|nr:sigma 54-interacting transcriptional regulator [Neobacillus cucumis]
MMVERTATNKDLLKMIRENVFREDLYHRLKVLFVHLPELSAILSFLPPDQDWIQLTK